MFKRISILLGLAMLLSWAPVTGIAQDKSATEEHHTGVKSTYLKAKHGVKHAWNKTKATTSAKYNKAKTRMTTDDSKRDAQEHK